MSVSSRVVIIGAGYAGVMTANRIAGNRRWSESTSVTVLNPAPDFLERIRLHEFAAGSRESASVQMRSVLHKRVALVEGTASRIDAEHRRVYLDGDSPPLEYDLLLYAAGSTHGRANLPTGAFTLTNDGEAARLRSRLFEMSRDETVNVIGAGLTGIEAAAEIAEQHPRLKVRLLSRDRIGKHLSNAGRHAVMKRLRALGVEMVENTDVQRCDASSIQTSGGVSLWSDCTVWTAGLHAPDLARDSGLPTDSLGRLIVDESLTCPLYPDIFGAGDAVRAPEAVAGHLRMSCAAALPLGAHAADSILARLDSRTPAPLSAGYLLTCISLGRKSGLIQTVRADDRPRRLVLKGRSARTAKEQVCRMTLSWLRGELRRSGSYSWPKGPQRAEVG